MRPFEVEPRNRFFEVSAAILKSEVDPKSKVTFFSEVELSEIESIRAQAAAKGREKISYTAFVVKAVALAMREYPYANRRACRRIWMPFSRLRLQRFNQIDVTVAIERDVEDAEMAAFVDIIREADRLSLAEINRKLRDLAESDTETNQQWRDYHRMVSRFPVWLTALILRLPLYFPNLWVKYRGGAAMISSPGKYGVDCVFANWWSPIGISFGIVKQRPVVHGERIVACPTFVLTVNFDVRVMAGAQAAAFGKHVIDSLESCRTAMADYLPADD